jgi:hypothetical protein
VDAIRCSNSLLDVLFIYQLLSRKEASCSGAISLIRECSTKCRVYILVRQPLLNRVIFSKVLLPSSSKRT